MRVLAMQRFYSILVAIIVEPVELATATDTHHLPSLKIVEVLTKFIALLYDALHRNFHIVHLRVGPTLHLLLL